MGEGHDAGVRVVHCLCVAGKQLDRALGLPVVGIIRGVAADWREWQNKRVAVSWDGKIRRCVRGYVVYARWERTGL